MRQPHNRIDERVRRAPTPNRREPRRGCSSSRSVNRVDLLFAARPATPIMKAPPSWLIWRALPRSLLVPWRLSFWRGCRWRLRGRGEALSSGPSFHAATEHRLHVPTSPWSGNFHALGYEPSCVPSQSTTEWAVSLPPAAAHLDPIVPAGIGFRTMNSSRSIGRKAISLLLMR